MYVGLLWVFAATGISRDWQSDEPVCWPELVVSRDGRDWQRVEYGTPFLPLGPRGSWDRRQIRTASSLVALDDRLLLLYAGTPDPHDGGMVWEIGSASVRRDGFAAMEARSSDGMLLTKPLRLQEGRLQVNAEVTTDGFVKAELLDGHGNTLPGYSGDRCVPVTSDTLEAPLSWTGNEGRATPVQHVEGGNVRLRFLLKNARLYSFWIDSTGDGASG